MRATKMYQIPSLTYMWSSLSLQHPNFDLSKMGKSSITLWFRSYKSLSWLSLPYERCQSYNVDAVSYWRSAKEKLSERQDKKPIRQQELRINRCETRLRLGVSKSTLISSILPVAYALHDSFTCPWVECSYRLCC